MATAFPSHSMPISFSYANAVKRLTLSEVSRVEKINICRRLLSSQYHPNPSATVLNFLCSLIAKEAPSFDKCYAICDITCNQEHARQDWNLFTNVMLSHTKSLRDHADHREPPLIPNAVLVQGGLHLLRGSLALRKAVAEALHLIIKQAQYSQDLETHTWLFCAIAKAEGPRSVLVPLRAAFLPHFSFLMSHEHDKDLVAAAAAAVASKAVPSWLASQVQPILVQSLRASPRAFHDRLATWVMESEASLPHTVQFLLRAYLKHPLKTVEERSSAKRAMWEPARRDAVEFFEDISDHILQAIRGDGDQRLWEERVFRYRMKTIQILYLVGSENAAYLPLQDQLPQGKKSKKSRKSANRQCTVAAGLQGLLRELIGIASSLNVEAEIRVERVQLTFEAIASIAMFSSDTIDEFMPDILASCLTKVGQPSDTISNVSNKSDLFCTLVERYQQSRSLNKFLGHLMKTSSLHSLVAVLRQKRVQDALGAAFSCLREAEAEVCIQSLIPKSPLPSQEIFALTLLYSLLLETIAQPFIQLAAVTIANQFVDLLLSYPVSPEIRQCRMHLLSSFLITKTANTFLSREEDVHVAMLRLALFEGAEKVSESEECAPLVSTLLEALSSAPDSMSAAELCSNLRCLTTLVHYSVQCHEDDERDFITRALQSTFAHFGILHHLLEKSNIPKNNDYISNTLYGSVCYRLVLRWLGSLGNLLARNSFLATGQKEVVLFLSQALQSFPATHPFWNELSEEPMWGPAVAKAACLFLEKRSQSFKCEKDIHVCPTSRVLVSISEMPSCFFVGPGDEKLLHMILNYMTVPCCSGGRLNALKACMNFSNSPGFVGVLSTFFQQGGHTDVQKVDHHLPTSPSKTKSIPRYVHLVVTMRVVASHIPEKQVRFLPPNLATLLRTAILGLKMACKRDVQLPNPSPGTWYEVVGALLDLRASLESVKDIGAINNGMLRLADAATECVKFALPLCVKSLGKKSSEEIPHTEAAEYMLSAMLKGTPPIYRRILSNEECHTLHSVLAQTSLPALVNPKVEKQHLALMLSLKLLVFEGHSREWVSQVLMSLLSRVLRRVRRHLPAVLRGDEACTPEALSKLISMATSLTISSAQLCNTSAFSLREPSVMANKGIQIPLSSQTHAGWSYNASTRILSGLEEFTRTWSCAVQELSMRGMTKLQTSILLSNSESLVCSSLKACLERSKASRSWLRGDSERIVLLTRQVVESICSCENFLRNEGEVLVNALRICRIAVRRYSGLVPSVSQVIGVMLRRGIATENMVILGAVREAVEEVCTISKTWEVLSALLADCSIALDETMGADSRREAEKSTAVLFKAVGERKAQQILGCLKDSGRESLRHIWELFSDKLHYSGK